MADLLAEADVKPRRQLLLATAPLGLPRLIRLG